MEDTVKNKCQFCGGETDLPFMFHAMAPINEDLEKLIDKLGRDTWWEDVDWDNPTDTEDKLSFYDQLLNTIGRSIVCKPCIERDDELHEKYYKEDGAGDS